MDDATPGGNIPSPFPDGEGFSAGHRIQPLIGGQQTFTAIEAAINQAQSTVHMAYWTFDPALRTSTGPDNATLSDLLRTVICRGVALRIVLADFDPVIGNAFHCGAWETYRELMSITDGLDAHCAARMTVMCSRHDMHWGILARTAAQPLLRYKLAEKVAAINDLETAEQRAACLADLPGLWPFLRFRDGRVSVKPLAYPGFYPAAHHEKLCVIDDRIVFLGGLDIDTKRQDDWTHDNAYPWHDVACRLEGPAAGFFANHFRSRWNQERVDSLAFLNNAHPPPGVRALPDGQGIPELSTAVATDAQLPDDIEARPLRTLSMQGRSGFSRSPTTQITEIRDAYLEVINQAEEFLYIETQYIRSTVIATALAERARAQPALELILLLPLVPEDAFIEDEPNIATRHGQYLRKINTDRLFQAFDDRIGVFSMQMPRNDDLPDAEDGDPKEIIRSTVYVHAKTIVCDDRTAIIGSANLNDRSLVTDTETAVLWRGEDSVRDYRVTLWRHALNIDTTEWTAPHLARWQAIARDNAEGLATGRYPFIVPFPRNDLDAHARRSWLVPDELV